jgi:hypothetical protein
VITDQRYQQPGRRYQVVRIDKDDYLVLKEFESSPTGGLHWTEFRGEQSDSDVSPP